VPDLGRITPVGIAILVEIAEHALRRGLHYF
jgi:hypothetical protein